MNGFIFAVQFLTRLPIRTDAEPTPELLGRSVLFYPLVGALIGAILWGVAKQAGTVEPMVIAALILTLWVAITGGLHLDGLADCADGWVGGQGDLNKTLAIMKDPNAGPMAVIALILLLIFKFSTIYALLKSGSPVFLFLAPVMGRAVVPALMIHAPYIRMNGLGQSMVEHLPKNAAQIVIGLVLLISLLIGGLLFTVCVIIFGLLLRKLFLTVFGGFTGDLYGAAIELTELSVLLGAVWLSS